MNTLNLRNFRTGRIRTPQFFDVRSKHPTPMIAGQKAWKQLETPNQIRREALASW